MSSSKKSKVFHAKFYVRRAMIEALMEDFETDDPSIAAKRAIEWGIQRIKDDIADGYTKDKSKVYYIKGGVKVYYEDEQ